MDIKITQWALNTFIELKRRGIFTDTEYKTLIRPNTKALENYPDDPIFKNTNFWNFAKFDNGSKIQDGYKMKWGKLGSGKNELRIFCAIIDGVAYICEGYAKTSPQQEQRMLCRFQTHADLIKQKKVKITGDLK